MLRALMLAVLLSGCATSGIWSNYAEPQSGATAKLRISSDADVFLIPERHCLDWKAPGAGLAVSGKWVFGPGKPEFNGRSIGMKGEVPAGLTSGEMLVPAGKPLVVKYTTQERDATMVYACEISFGFVPLADEEYQLSAYMDIPGKRCHFLPVSILQPERKVPAYAVKACK